MYKQSIKTVKLYSYWLFLILSVFLPIKIVRAEKVIDICQAITKTDNVDTLNQWRKNNSNIVLDDIDCQAGSLLRIVIRELSKRGEFSSTIRSTRYDNLIWLLDNGIDINQNFYNGGNVINSISDINLIYLLVERGAKANVKNNSGTTRVSEPFISLDSLNLLLHLGADPELGESFGKTALDEAVVSCSLEHAEILLQHGAKIPKTLLEYRRLLHREKRRCLHPEKKSEIFHLLAKYQRLREKAIAQGADPDKLTFNPPPPPKKRLLPSQEDPPIVRATRENDLEAVKKLITAGVDLDAISKSGEAYNDLYSATALHIALSLRHKEIARLLIKSGANTVIHNANGHHPLYLAAYDYELTKLLIDRGAPVHQGGGAKCAIPALMSDYLTAEVAELLLQNGARINEAKCRFYTPLYVAIDNKNYSLVKLLVERGANVNPIYIINACLFIK